MGKCTENRPALVRHACPCRTRAGPLRKLTITSRTTRRPRAGGAGKEAAVGEHCGSPTARSILRPARGRPLFACAFRSPAVLTAGVTRKANASQPLCGTPARAAQGDQLRIFHKLTITSRTTRAGLAQAARGKEAAVGGTAALRRPLSIYGLRGAGRGRRRMRIPFAGGLDRRLGKCAENRPALVRHACPCRTRDPSPQTNNHVENNAPASRRRRRQKEAAVGGTAALRRPLNHGLRGALFACAFRSPAVLTAGWLRALKNRPALVRHACPCRTGLADAPTN